MGSSSMLDIVGSFIVGGALLVMALRLNAQASEATAIYGVPVSVLICIVEPDHLPRSSESWSAFIAA